MFSGKFDRGFDVLKNPNPRFFEFEARLPGYGCASSRRKQVEKLGGRFADILRLSDKLQDGDHEQNLNKDQQHEENKAASIDTKFFLCITTFKYKDKLMQHLRKAKEEHYELLGPKSDYTPQTEKSVGRSSAEPMNVTKALTCLGMVTGRGMDNGAAGAQLLANQVSVVVHDLEQKRVDCLKTQQKLKRERENNIRTFKSSDQLEKEKNNSKWETSKVREDLCLAHEAYQFFRIKYSKRYGDVNPTPDVFEKVVP